MPMISREMFDEREDAVLAPYAMRNSQSRGRKYPDEKHPYRAEYQRDRDRIIHTTPFRRLEYKTQVFVYSEGDHYRNRLTHSIEVAQIGRTLARALGCNEDLTEAICLAHDLGHPPFGHVGESTLNALMQDHGGFDHQKQTLRIVTEIEDRYPPHPGLNLTYEVLEGVVKHDPQFDARDAGDFHPEERGTLECQLADLADEIAYNTSDLDDGLRSGILEPEEVAELAVSGKALEDLGLESGADFRDDRARRRFIRRLVDLEVTDVVTTTVEDLERYRISSLADLRSMPFNVAHYSEEMEAGNRALVRFLYQRFYHNYRVARMAAKAERTLNELFRAYVDKPRQLPGNLQQRLRSHPEGLPRAVCDYLSGMTDRYAIQEHLRLFDLQTRP